MKLKDEAQLVLDIEKMLAAANKAYDDAARFHAMGKVNFAAGQRAALTAVLQLFETVPGRKGE